MKMNCYFEDFTEAEYREILKVAKANWDFIDFTDYRKTGKVCLWRHDVDISFHRAYRLAQIEADECVKATYFIHLHSEFYNPLEREVADVIREIQKLGHRLGLHYDPDFYSGSLPGHKRELDWLNFEQNILERTFQTHIQVFSLHNPDVGNWLGIDENEIRGLINAYGNYLREHYTYVSDANGYWRFQRLRDILETRKAEKIYVLTHPEWWTPESMSPRKRISRAIEGRAAKAHKRYDDLLAKTGRKNVR